MIGLAWTLVVTHWDNESEKVILLKNFVTIHRVSLSFAPHLPFFGWQIVFPKAQPNNPKDSKIIDPWKCGTVTQTTALFMIFPLSFPVIMQFARIRNIFKMKSTWEMRASSGRSFYMKTTGKSWRQVKHCRTTYGMIVLCYMSDTWRLIQISRFLLHWSHIKTSCQSNEWLKI